MNAIKKWRLLTQALAVALVSFMLSCTGGGGETPSGDNNAPAPQVFGLDKSSANIGDSVLVLGKNFGDSQGAGSVVLNGTAFTVNTWSPTQIAVTVVAGMSSGIVAVTQSGKSSVNGQEAQLFIGTAPQGDPIVYALSPEYGRRGQDQILITGINFGTSGGAGDDGVYFSADASVSAVGYVEADVVLDAATSAPIWTNASIRVIVPSNAKTGDMYIVAGGVESNHKAFEAQPPSGPAGAPIIVNFAPANGPIGTQVVIQGNNFGFSQGNSTCTLGGKGLDILEWTNTAITGSIPSGAVTGAFNIQVGGSLAVSGTNFIVANSPIITGVSPSSVRVGQPVTVYGNFFGFQQGAGNLKIGGTTIPNASLTWNNTTITVSSLPTISASDPNNVPCVVTNNEALSSLPFALKLVSDITGVVTVRPKAGVAGKTNFKFSCSAAGGSGNYEYALIPDAGSPGTSIVSALPIAHIYNDKGVYSTSMKITDKTTGDVAIVGGPSVNVVGPTEMVITAIEAVDFGQPEPAENLWTRDYQAPAFTKILYKDFVFFQGTNWFTSSLADLYIPSTNTKLPSYLRDQNAFLAGSPSSRPYGYRHKNGSGNVVRIHGFNFGTTQGNIYLKANVPGDGTQVDPLGVTWGLPGNVDDQDELIEFILPATPSADLSGFVVVERTDNGQFSKSVDQLICTSYVTSSLPDPVALDGTLQVSGFDLTAPVVGGISGSTTCLMFVAMASYTDPFTNLPDTQMRLCVHPFPVSVVGTLITFNMVDLDSDGDASNGITTDIEVPSSDGSTFQVVLGATLQAGAWQYFVWSGADLTNGSNSLKANSGVMSDYYDINVDPAGGGGPGGSPIAALTGNPLSGASPLPVNFDAGGSTDPGGSIVNYEWDFNNNANFGDLPEETAQAGNATASYTFSPDGSYPVTVKVTDNDANTDTASVTVNVGGGGPGNNDVSGKCEKYTANWDPFSGDPEPLAPWQGAKVLVDADPAGNNLGFAISDASGNYTVTGIPDGNVKVHVDPLTVLDQIVFPPSGNWFRTLPLAPPESLNFKDSNGFQVGQ